MKGSNMELNEGTGHAKSTSSRLCVTSLRDRVCRHMQTRTVHGDGIVPASVQIECSQTLAQLMCFRNVGTNDVLQECVCQKECQREGRRGGESMPHAQTGKRGWYCFCQGCKVEC